MHPAALLLLLHKAPGPCTIASGSFWKSPVLCQLGQLVQLVHFPPTSRRCGAGKPSAAHTSPWCRHSGCQQHCRFFMCSLCTASHGRNPSKETMLGEIAQVFGHSFLAGSVGFTLRVNPSQSLLPLLECAGDSDTSSPALPLLQQGTRPRILPQNSPFSNG